MAFGPSWLSSNKEAAPEAPPAPAPTAREIQEMKDLPGVIQFMRLLNLGAAGGLIAAGVSLSFESDSSIIVFVLYTHHQFLLFLCAMKSFPKSDMVYGDFTGTSEICIIHLRSLWSLCHLLSGDKSKILTSHDCRYVSQDFLTSIIMKIHCIQLMSLYPWSDYLINPSL
jgi:hypothetical protein